MKEETRNEIEGIFRKCDLEHPLKTGSDGLKLFSRMVTLVDELDDEEFQNFLVPRLDACLKKQESCLSCYAKLCSFAEIYCRRRESDLWKKYRLLMTNRLVNPQSMEDTERDYYGEAKKEVSIYLESLPPNEEESKPINPFDGEGLFKE